MKSHKSEVAITFNSTNQETVGSPLNQMHRQQLELIDVLLLHTGGKRTKQAQRTSFNSLDNWGHKTPTQSKMSKDEKEMIKRVMARNTYNTLGCTVTSHLLYSVLLQSSSRSSYVFTTSIELCSLFSTAKTL